MTKQLRTEGNAVLVQQNNTETKRDLVVRNDRPSV